MVSIPVKLYTATENQDISFRQLHRTDNSPIKLVKRCAADGQELENDEIVKGYEYTNGQFVLIDDAEIDRLPVPSKQAIELSAFVPGDQIDPVYYEKSYFVEPEEVARKPYALLSQVLVDRGMLGIGKLAMRQKERLVALRPRDGGIQLETLYYGDEVRRPEFDFPQVEVSDAELKVANALVDLLAEDFDASNYRDGYRDAVLAMITAKLEGQEFVAAPEPKAAKPAVDLMAALRASVEAAKAGKAPARQPSNGRTRAKAAEPAPEPVAVEVAAKPARRRKAASPS